MKVLIIGGSRYFGKRLAQLHVENGSNVTLLNRGQTDDGLGPAVARIRCDRTHEADLTAALGDREWDVVYDQVCYNAQEAEAACRVFRGRTGKFIFTSSQSVYGGGSDIPETAFDPFQYKFVPTPDVDYGEAKKQAEAVFHQRADFPVISVRFSIVLGPDDYTGRLKFHVDRIRNGTPIYFPNLDARVSFADSADAANALYWMSRAGFEGPVNCTSPDPVRLRDLVFMIEKATGKAPKLLNEKSANGENDSPFGASTDWCASVNKLRELGYQTLPTSEWFEKLIRQI